MANEQVVEGKCERCQSEVIQKEIEQWFFKITDYTEDLLKGLEKLDWPEKTKIAQKNWLGKSEGVEIKFKIQDSEFKIPVFTTRTDTLFGATYLVVTPEHPIIQDLKPQISNFKFIEKYIEESKKKTERERISEMKEKTGIEIRGIKAINPVNGREIPIFAADYVLVHYGTGVIMAVPGHDSRDFVFARKYNLPIIDVIQPYSKEKKLPQKAPLVVSGGRFERPYQGEGYLINSGRFNGMDSKKARERMAEWLIKRELGQKAIYYKLKDWLISRQRYWGCPIPMIFCQKCNWQSVKEKDLPVLLPKVKDYLPAEEGKSPLAKSKKFIEVVCPKCKNLAQRETDTMDTFVCSAWYYLRYADPENNKKFVSKEKLKNWLPVKMYIGGAEHTVLHLLYSRFFTKALKNLGYLNFDEPFLSLYHQGIILGPDSQKMSKSRGNVIDPDKEVKKYGADTIRMYLSFMGPYDQGGPWNPKGIIGIYRFLEKVWNLQNKIKKSKIPAQKQVLDEANKNQELEKIIHKTIKKVTEDIENFKFNTAISALMILVNEMLKFPRLTTTNYQTILLLLAPFAPHLAEELWQKYFTKIPNPKIKIKNSIHNQSWPGYDKKLIKEKKLILIIQINGKVRDKIEVESDISEEKLKKLAFAEKKVQKWIEGKRIKKIIFVPGKLINIVIWK